MSYFNVRVYGILVNERNEVLLSDERQFGQDFTKFPGGGLEIGEGIRDGLIREYQEECGISVQVIRHVFTIDHYVPSAFNDSQVIALYYQVTASDQALATIPMGRKRMAADPADKSASAWQSFRWVPLEQMTENQLTFEIDRIGWRHFLDLHRADSVGGQPL